MPNNIINMDGSFKPFKAWCQHVLPLVYDDSLSYMELLNKVIVYINSFGEYLEEYTVINKITYEGIWDITKNYKANSVVSDHNYGYLSVKATPAGIPITNTEYWLKIADFAGELIDLGSRVLELETKMTTVEGKVTTLESQMSTANTNITNLTGRVNTAENNITSLTTNVSNLGNRMTKAENNINALKSWSNRKVLWVGDSYGNGWNGSATLLEKPYVVASNKMGCSYVDISVGGSRFGTSGGAEYQYKTHIEDYVNSHSDMDTFTDVIIIGGANDINFNPSEDLTSPIQSCVSYVKAHFPNAIIHIGMVARLAQTGATNCTLGNVWNMTNKYRNGAIDNGVNYIEKSELINHDYSLLASDGIHLTNYVPMGTKLASLLMTGDFERSSNVAFQCTRASTDNDNLKADIWSTANTIQIGTEVIIDITDIQFNFSPAKSIAWKRVYKIAKISGDANCRNLFAAGTKSLRWTIPAAVDFQVNGTSYNSVQPFTFYFYDNYLWMSWESLVNPGGVTMNATAIYMRQGIQLRIDENYC